MRALPSRRGSASAEPRSPAPVRSQFAPEATATRAPRPPAPTASCQAAPSEHRPGTCAAVASRTRPCLIPLLTFSPVAALTVSVSDLHAAVLKHTAHYALQRRGEVWLRFRVANSGVLEGGAFLYAAPSSALMLCARGLRVA